MSRRNFMRFLPALPLIGFLFRTTAPEPSEEWRFGEWEPRLMVEGIDTGSLVKDFWIDDDGLLVTETWGGVKTKTRCVRDENGLLSVQKLLNVDGEWVVL